VAPASGARIVLGRECFMSVREARAISTANPRALRSLTRSAFGRVDVLVSSVLINLLSLALPLVILQTFDRVVPNSAHETFVFLLVGLGIVVVVDGGLRMARSYITAWGAARFEHAVSCRTIKRMLGAEILGFEREPSGIQIARVNAIDTLRDLYAGQGMLALIDLPFVVVFLAIIGLVGGWLVVVPISVIGVVGLLAYFIGAKLRAALEFRQTVDDRRYSFVIEVLSSMPLVKGLALEGLMLRRYERLLRGSAEAVHNVILKSGLAQAHGAIFSNFTMISVSGVGALLVLDGRLTLGTLAACMLLAGRSVQPVLRAIAVWVQFQNVRVAESQLEEVMALTPEARNTSRPAPDISGATRFEDMGFIYPKTETALFRNLDFNVEAGETVALVGENGSGKSTFLWLAMGLLAPTVGRICHDGISLTDVDPAEIRRQVAYLPQRSSLYRGTIRENLTMFSEDDRLDAAMEYAHALELDKVLARLPDGLDTELGSSSNDILSAGVRQRIAIVRALAARPKLMLFDEANSTFDFRTDDRLRELLESMRGTTTMILVSHRPSLVRMADRVCEIVDHQIRPRSDAEADRPDAPAGVPNAAVGAAVTAGGASS
jgi:ATP-binding cassette subfamily C protein LapB